MKKFISALVLVATLGMTGCASMNSQPIQVKPIVKTDIIEEVVDDKKNTTAKDESGQSTNVRNSNKKQQTGKGRRPRWRKRRSSNQNKNND